jgi:hypothetical protein
MATRAFVPELSALSGPLGPGSKTEEELKNRGYLLVVIWVCSLFRIATRALSDRAPAGVANAALMLCALPCTYNAKSHGMISVIFYTYE